MARWFLLAAFCVAYAMSQFFRSALAVTAPAMSETLGLKNEQMGVLSTVFFWSFAAMQIPLGVALDRFSPHVVVATTMLALVLGSGLQFFAGSYEELLAAQLLFGIGCAPVLMGAYVTISRLWPLRDFAWLAGIVMTVGNLGNLLGTIPLVMLMAAIGWREAMAVVGMIGLFALIIMALAGRSCPTPPPSGPVEGVGVAFLSAFSVLRLRPLWRLLPMVLLGYAALITVRSFWAGPFLTQVHHQPPGTIAEIVLLMALGMVLAPVLSGRLERTLGRRKPIVIGGSAITLLALLGLAFGPGQADLTAATALLVIIGFAGSGYTLVMAHGRQFLPPALVGRGMSLLNAVTFVGAGLMQIGCVLLSMLGYSLGWETGPRYSLIFAAIAGLLGMALTAYCFSRDKA